MDDNTVNGECTMRKVCVIVLSVVLAFSALFSMSVTAASNTYDISALGLQVKVTIPEEYDVSLRDTSKNSEISSEFERYGIYLKAISRDNIVVTISKHTLKHFDLLSDTTLDEIVSPLKERYHNGGLKILKYRLCRNSQAPFLEIFFNDPARKISALQYYTVYNGRAVSFILYSATDRLDEKQENVLKDVVNNARISNTTTVTEPEENTEAFQYTDIDTGVTNADRPELPNQDSVKASLYNAAVIVFVVLVLLIIATVIVIVTITISKKRKKIMPQLDSSPYYHAPEMQPVGNTEKAAACRKCGEKLIDNSQFCTQCGAEIVEAKNMSEYEQNDVLRTEIEEKAMFCRKCGQKLSPENNSQCAFCGTVVEYYTEVDTPAPKADMEEPAQPETKPKKKSVKKIILIASLSLVLLAGIVCAALFFMGPKATPQDINTINGCPEFYNVEFGMTVGQASELIEMKHDPIKGVEGSSYFEVDDFMKNSHIIFDEGEVFNLYGIETASVYVSFDEKYVDGVMFTFDKKAVSYDKIVDLYIEIYGSATTVSSFSATWIGSKTTIDVYDYEIISDDGEKTIVVRYSITENSQYTTLSFDGPELDPCDFLGKNNAFDKKPSYYTNGLKKDDDYSYEKFSAGSFASFEKYTLYPRFEYMGIGKGYTAITFDKDGSEDTIGLVSYLFLLDKSNAVDRMSYIEKALTQKYGAYSSCTYTSTEYSELGIADITFDELKQKVGSNTQGIYNVQWESKGRKITLGLTISVDKTYYDGSVAYTD